MLTVDLIGEQYEVDIAAVKEALDSYVFFRGCISVSNRQEEEIVCANFLIFDGADYEGDFNDPNQWMDWIHNLGEYAPRLISKARLNDYFAEDIIKRKESLHSASGVIILRGAVSWFYYAPQQEMVTNGVFAEASGQIKLPFAA